MTDEEIIDKACSRLGKDVRTPVKMLFDYRDVLEGVAWEIRDKAGELSEDNWNPTYHLPLTITVEDARNVLQTIKALDKFFRGEA